jgi:hypothetical protein
VERADFLLDYHNEISIYSLILALDVPELVVHPAKQTAGKVRQLKNPGSP